MRVLLGLLLWLGVSFSAQAEKRLALVIGNSAYDAEAGGYLPNPVRDADTVAAALRDVGFEVTLKKNLDDKGLKRAIRGHKNRLKSAGSGAINFFYYAGHGANDRQNQFGGTNYFIPVGAVVQRVSDLDIEAVELGDAIRAFSDASVSFVVFDACRNYPFPSSDTRSITRGFVSEPERKGTFVAFSSEPGSVAFDDSGYANALATALRTPGIHHVDLFRKVRTIVREKTNGEQFAWYRDGVDGDVVFKERTDPPVTPVTFDAETVLWEELQGSCKGLEAYIDRYPSGRFSSTARSRLNQSPCKTSPSNSTASSPVQQSTKTASQAYSDGRAAELAKDYDTAVGEYRIACDKGSMNGCANLGFMYRNGRGVEQSDNQALALYREGCLGGSALGCTNLGSMYENGWGVQRSYTEAVALYRKGCDGGSAGGCTNLGLSYDNGRGVVQSYSEAASLYRKGCDGGDARGCTNLGIMYDQGQGVAQSYSEAASLYRKACDGGDASSCTNLGYLLSSGLGVAQSYSEAASLYREGCDGGNARGCTNLGLMYRNGKGVTQSDSQAASLFRKACDGGIGSACTILGEMYRNGKGVTQSKSNAIRYAKMGCDVGNQRGCENLKIYEAN